MIGERNMVQDVVLVVGVERSPAAVSALHPEHPLDAAFHGFAASTAVRAVQTHHHHGCVVDVRIMVVPVLEWPASGPDAGNMGRIVADDVKHLPVAQPGTRLLHNRLIAAVACLEQAVQGETCIPHRGQAGLAIGLVGPHDQQPVDGPARRDHVRMLRRIAERSKRHQGIRHRREDSAETILSVQPLSNKRHGLVRRMALQRLGQQPLQPAADAVDGKKDVAEPMSSWIGQIGTLRLGRFREQFLDADASRVARTCLLHGQNKQRQHHGSRPVRDLVHVEWRPAGQQDRFDPHERRCPPGNLPEQRQREPREDIATRSTAPRQDGLACPAHVPRIRIVTDQLQGVVGFHRRADVAFAIVIQRPAAIGALRAPQIGGDSLLDDVVDLAQEVIEQDIFRRNRGVGFQLEDPVPVFGLPPNQPLRRFGDHAVDIVISRVDRGQSGLRMSHCLTLKPLGTPLFPHGNNGHERVSCPLSA